MNTKKLWISFILVMTISFAVLIYYGREIYRQAPPVPDKVMTADGTLLFTGQDIKDGQNIWQSVGVRKWEQYGDMVPTRHPTGVLTGCTKKLFICLIKWRFRPTACHTIR